MKILHGAVLALLVSVAMPLSAQVAPRDVNGARNSATDGTRLDTNVTFSLRMTLSGEETLRNSAELGQDVSIRTVIRPEAEDVGKPADIIIVDYRPPIPYMRNIDGNFVAWNGKLKDLVPSQEGVALTAELDVEIFSGQLGATGDHRIFVGFLVDGVLFFTPSALRLTITEPAPPTPTAREQAITLFESTISPRIVQGICIACHVSGGQADGLAFHIFVRSTNANHLDLNFETFEGLHNARGTDLILSKVRGVNHIGGVVLTQGSTNYNSLAEFLGLLDDAANTSASPLLNSSPATTMQSDSGSYGAYEDYYNQ